MTSAESAAGPGKLRVRAGLAFVQVLRPALYALLVLSALFTFWAGGDIAGHGLPSWTQVAAPTLFAVFLVVFAIYRFALVRARKYPAATGFFQVGLGALIWVMLLPGTRQKIAPPPASADSVPVLMTSSDARVRALAAELAGLRPHGSKYAAQLIDRLDDSDAAVRARAHESLVHIAGTDPGTSTDAWRELAKRRGWER
ncbi:MAG: hypothetical protein ABR567_23185 [Myxococcales bacterium]|nr:hypothetical protein [Myxococcales bacterium]